MKVELLGVKIDDINQSQVLEKIEKWIWNSGKHYIVTPNPEILMAAQKDQVLRKILNDADLSIPDGAGLKLSGKIKNTVPGIDLMEKLIALSAEKGFTIGLLGGQKGVAERLKECLERRYQNISAPIKSVSVKFASSGGEIDMTGKSISGEKIEIPKLDILFVAFGHIKQEKWIKNNLNSLPIKVAMGVGGAFDYLSGNTPRAPKFIRDLGFEWLFRLIVQPGRLIRQMALIKYLLMIM